MRSRVLGGLRPEHVATVGEHITLELFQVPVEMIDGLPFDGGGVGASVLPVGEAQPAPRDRRVVRRDGFLNDTAMTEVGSFFRRVVFELLEGGRHVAASTSASEIVLIGRFWRRR